MTNLIDKLERSSAIRLADALDYKSGEAVSVSLTQLPNVFMKLLAFDRGTGLPEHGGKGEALVCILDGEAEFDICGDKVRVKSGESLVIPSDAPHSVTAITPFKMLLTVVGED